MANKPEVSLENFCRIAFFTIKYAFLDLTTLKKICVESKFTYWGPFSASNRKNIWAENVSEIFIQQIILNCNDLILAFRGQSFLLNYTKTAQHLSLKMLLSCSGSLVLTKKVDYPLGNFGKRSNPLRKGCIWNVLEWWLYWNSSHGRVWPLP